MVTGTARYAQDHGTWFLQLAGDLRHTLGPALNALLDRAFAAAETEGFLLDLSAAEAIDSTCLGVLARIASWAREQGAPRPVIVTANEDIIETLYAVCFDRLFELRTETSTLTHAWNELDPAPVATRQMTDLVLDAHRRLGAIDEGNRGAFGEVIEALEREQASNGRDEGDD